MDEDLKARILRRIAAEGAVPFDEYMRLALYDPAAGYFRSGVVRSTRDGDFLTSPEVGADFGATIAAHVAEVWDTVGRPTDFIVCDAGAGSGSLLSPLSDALQFSPRLLAVEVSPPARTALANRVPHAEVLSSSGDLPATFTGVVVANELLDNLPMAVAIRAGDAWTEQWVDGDGDNLTLVTRPARPEVLEWLETAAGEVPDGGIVEVQIEAASWVADICQRLRAGALIIFDYGDDAAGLAHRRRGGTLRTYVGHHLGPDPLDSPGVTDITADVNFTPLLDVAQQLGCTVRIERQADYLESWGLADSRARLRETELSLARSGDHLERLRVRTRIGEIDTLLHPRGLGDFRVLVAEKVGTE